MRAWYSQSKNSFNLNRLEINSNRLFLNIRKIVHPKINFYKTTSPPVLKWDKKWTHHQNCSFLFLVKTKCKLFRYTFTMCLISEHHVKIAQPVAWPDTGNVLILLLNSCNEIYVNGSLIRVAKVVENEEGCEGNTILYLYILGRQTYFRHWRIEVNDYRSHFSELPEYF